MGLDVHSLVLVGVKLDPICKEERQTKYNEDTGAPYTKTIKRNVFVISGTNIEIHKNKQKGKIDVVSASYEDEESYFFGTVVARTDSHRDGELWTTFHLPDLTNKQRQTLYFLQKHYHYDGVVSLFVITQLGY